VCFDFFGFAILLQKSGNPRWDWVGWGGRYRPDDHVVDTTLSSHVPPAIGLGKLCKEQMRKDWESFASGVLECGK
jgi:hypothetical protein